MQVNPFGSKTINQYRAEINNDKKYVSGVGFVIKKATSLKTQPAKEKVQVLIVYKESGNDDVCGDDGKWEAVNKKKGIERRGKNRKGIFRVW